MIMNNKNDKNNNYNKNIERKYRTSTTKLFLFS